ncbi:hypothetical protein KEM55_004814, partial [Ascosphaera atra]
MGIPIFSARRASSDDPQPQGAAFSSSIDPNSSPDIEKRGQKGNGDLGITSIVADQGTINSDVDYTKRKLKTRHVQLMGIGGTIGTVLFVQIGKALMAGGPASLFIAFSF